MRAPEGKPSLVIRTHAPVSASDLHGRGAYSSRCSRCTSSTSSAATTPATTAWPLHSADRARGADRAPGKANRELRTHLAELDTIRIGRAREQAEVSRSIGDLQAQVARQTQELAFYRGSWPRARRPSGVKIQQVRIAQGSKPRQFVLHMALVRSVRPRQRGRGLASALSVDGESAGGQCRDLDLPTSDRRQAERAAVQLSVLRELRPGGRVPAGLKPETGSIEVRSSHKTWPR